MLIVCEGEKTEPTYFTEIKDHYEINSANICITGDCGSSPLSVVAHAWKLYQAEKEKGDGYDRVYCVFDQDNYNLPPNPYQQALNKINAIKPKDIFLAITSVPCFEYWLLLHFKYTTQPFTSVGGVTVGKAVLNSLKEHWPEYEKAMRGVFTSQLSKLNFAIANANRSLEEAKTNLTDHPSTHIHKLVTYLMDVKNNRHSNDCNVS